MVKLPTEKKLSNEIQIAKDLAEQGYEDVLMLNRETAQKVFTEKRMELIEIIKEGETESVRELSRKVGRDVSGVSKDLKLLYEHDLIKFEKGKQNRKAPKMRHANIFVKPIITKTKTNEN
ncbi:MAG: hypothetical protein BRC28_03145 [Nanohaloarchaea archaeon SW_4_43_9]|nr:MAG: hypothetical protein BRC28_03145 [Nanohaloarchaea archaeon SW_4_43_9]